MIESNMYIRVAEPSDAPTLTDIAMTSKAYWGYDETFMEACREELTISPAYVEANLVFVVEEDGSIQGFVTAVPSPPNAVLDFLYIHPSAMKRGYGRALWNHVMETLRGFGVQKVSIDADPNAESFYTAMGAVTVGRVPSGSIPGRTLPLMEVTL